VDWKTSARTCAATTCIALACLSSAACGGPERCTDAVLLGRVNRAGAESISRADVEEQRARAGTTGTWLTRRVAFADLLWQETERLRLGLPGGERAAESRRRLVTGHARRLLDHEVAPLRTKPEELPPDAQLTDCGRITLEETD